MKLRILFSAVLVTALALPVIATANRFPDVPADHQYAEAIQWASDREWFNGDPLFKGKPDGNFDPAEPLTEGQLLKVIKRLFDSSDDWTRADVAALFYYGYPALRGEPPTYTASVATTTTTHPVVIEGEQPGGAGPDEKETTTTTTSLEKETTTTTTTTPASGGDDRLPVFEVTEVNGYLNFKLALFDAPQGVYFAQVWTVEDYRGTLVDTGNHNLYLTDETARVMEGRIKCKPEIRFLDLRFGLITDFGDNVVFPGNTVPADKRVSAPPCPVTTTTTTTTTTSLPYRRIGVR